MATKVASEEKAAPVVHTKEQLLSSKKYADMQDLISALLEDGKSYTLNEVDELIENYLKGSVK